MAGYLDAAFAGGFGVAPGSSSLRLVIDRVLASGDPTRRRVFSFGTRVRPVPTPSNQDVIRTLVQQDFYRDNDTRLEDVLDSIALDRPHSRTHLIVTDGRRGSGADALAQYRRLGELAQQWSASSTGLFAFAVLDAPFAPVRNDQAGCWKGKKASMDRDQPGEESAGQPLRCPLYVALFAPRNSAIEILDRLRSTSAHLVVAPTPTDSIVVLVANVTPKPSTLLVRGGRELGIPLHMFFRAPGSANDASVTRASVTLATEFEQSAGRFALDDVLQWRLQSAQITTDASASAWTPVRNATEAWVSPGTPSVEGRRRVVLPVELRARAEVRPTRYYLELLSTGRPAWLQQYEAAQQGDATRTFGLSELFAQLHSTPTTLAGFTISIY
jgi:hypothetical protein